MSCGRHLPGRTHLGAQAARLLWPGQLGDAADIELWVNGWERREEAAESRRLNETEHGHAGACYGPVLTEAGWVTALDLRPAIRESRMRRR